jgi:hypothetical protein
VVGIGISCAKPSGRLEQDAGGAHPLFYTRNIDAIDCCVCPEALRVKKAAVRSSRVFQYGLDKYQSDKRSAQIHVLVNRFSGPCKRFLKLESRLGNNCPERCLDAFKAAETSSFGQYYQY